MNREEDNLEKYIRENRKKFDIYKPGPSIKRAIFSSTYRGRRVMMVNKFLRVASVAIITGFAMILAYNTGINKSKNSLSGISPELLETEQYYELLMNSVFTRANTIFATYPGLEEETRADIEELEKIGKELRDDLKENISNREVIEALIMNYRFRITLLEDLVKSMEEEGTEIENTRKNEI
jgi:hypothetical protein